MSKLSGVTDDELEAELARRKQAKNQPPSPVENPDFTELCAICAGFVRSLGAGEYEDEDAPQYVYEAAMKAIYGDGYFVWRNAVTR